ncbi:DUF5956 family protein [Arthrobacter sp. zg-Y844]|uniref:DUF5956 family protein n=1 Tax=Arthrobacter sp. zg-Y844 TaxID=2964612 RepID=UPI002108455C|nr:DUF5956 family protein [Arthrobacter sp. zg-Y844]MCQ1985859.1 DUF5956 family protein [Arthrobacter sp. zg-Y844]
MGQDMAGSWNEVRILPPEARPDAHTQLPFTGWFLMMGWAARAQHTYRHPGTLYETLPTQELFAPEDEEWVYQMTNDYLALVGVPPVPRGYVWFLARPAGITSDEALWRRLNEKIDEVGGIPHFDGPAYVTGAYPVIAEAVRRLY